MAARWGRPVSGRQTARGRVRTRPAEVAEGPHGIVEIGGLLHAIPLDFVREVTPRPLVLLPFPSPCADVIGAMQLRGAIIPVLDAAQTLGLAEARPAGHVLVLRMGSGIAGITVERVHGVWSIEASQITPFGRSSTDGSELETIVAGFTYGDRQGVILDPAALAQRQSIPVAADRAETRAKVTRGHPAILFRAGGMKLGIDARAVVATVPDSAVEPGPLAASLWYGFVRHVGKRVPLLDTLGLLGVGAYPRDARAGSIILRLGTGAAVALRIDAVEDMVRLDDAAIGPMGAMTGMNRELFRGLYKGDGESLILDAAALQANPQLIEVGKLETTHDTAGTVDTGGPRKPYLKFVLSDRVFAAPLEQVEEIIRTPERLVRTEDAGDGNLGLIAHRGGAVPLLDIRDRLGLTGAGEGGFAILTMQHGAMAAILVDRLDSVERLPVQSLSAKPPGEELDLLRNTIVTGGVACPVLDLRAMAVDGAARASASPIAA